MKKLVICLIAVCFIFCSLTSTKEERTITVLVGRSQLDVVQFLYRKGFKSTLETVALTEEEWQHAPIAAWCISDIVYKKEADVFALEATPIFQNER